jgi:CO/xanthine dehydrogenase FAD-binding subunit
MIVEYHRPETLETALDLLARPGVVTVPLGGGTILNQPSPDPVAVVDLQALGLNNLEEKWKKLQLGATVTLQRLLDFEIVPALKAAIRHQARLPLWPEPWLPQMGVRPSLPHCWHWARN